jgi:NADH-quinone oxidoreductase subunit N
MGKFYVFSAAYERGWSWLIIVGVAATAVSLYYYLGVVRSLYMRTPELTLAPAGGSPPPERLLQASVAACLAVTVGSFFAVQPLIDLARHGAAALPF